MEKVENSMEGLFAVAIQFEQTVAPQSYAWSGTRSRMGYEVPITYIPQLPKLDREYIRIHLVTRSYLKT